MTMNYFLRAALSLILATGFCNVFAMEVVPAKPVTMSKPVDVHGNLRMGIFPPDTWRNVARSLPGNDQFLNWLCRCLNLDQETYNRIVAAVFQEMSQFMRANEMQYFIRSNFKTFKNVDRDAIMQKIEHAASLVPGNLFIPDYTDMRTGRVQEYNLEELPYIIYDRIYDLDDTFRDRPRVVGNRIAGMATHALTRTSLGQEFIDLMKREGITLQVLKTNMRALYFAQDLLAKKLDSYDKVTHTLDRVSGAYMSMIVVGLVSSFFWLLYLKAPKQFSSNKFIAPLVLFKLLEVLYPALLANNVYYYPALFIKIHAWIVFFRLLATQVDFYEKEVKMLRWDRDWNGGKCDEALKTSQALKEKFIASQRAAGAIGQSS